MDVDLLKAIWNGMDMDMDSYVNPHVDFVAWIRTLIMFGVFSDFAMYHLTACQTANRIFSNSQLKRTLRRCIAEKHLCELGKQCAILI